MDIKIIFKNTLFALITVNLLIAFSQIISNYYNYGAESIDFASMLRISQSKPYVSNLNELPLLISSYSPILFGLLYPFIKILNLNTIREVAFLGRLTILSIVFIFSLLENNFFQKYFPDRYNRSIFFFSLLWFFILFPGDILSVKPDFLAFMFEFLAFSFFYKSTFELLGRSSCFYFSSIFAGFAVATKVNTLGIFIGILLFLITIKKIREALIYSIVTLVTIIFLFSLFYWKLGKTFISNVLISTQTTPEFGFEFVRNIFSLPQKVVFPYGIFYLLILIGLWIILKDNTRKAMLFSFCLGISFLLATLGQLKIGAFLNYYFGFFMLAIIPVSIAIKFIFEAAKTQTIYKPLQVIIILLVTLNIINSLVFPARIFVNDFKNYPYEEAQAYVKDNYPDGYVYTAESDHSLPLYFFNRTLLGPWAETQLNIVPAFSSYIPMIKEELSKYHFSVAIKMGSGCENWQPSGIFLEETRHLSHLDKKLKKICIFN